MNTSHQLTILKKSVCVLIDLHSLFVFLDHYKSGDCVTMISMVCNLLIAVVLIAMMVETEAFIMTKRKTMPSSLHIRQHESKEQLVIVPTGGRSYTAKFTSPNKNRLHLAKDDDSANNLGKLKSRKKGSNRENNDEPLVEMLLTKYENEIDELCQATYNIMKATIFPPVRDYINIQKNKVSNENNKDPFAKLIAPPELPGIPRPVWLVILGSIPTGLIWYGYYKFSIEEELYHLELESENGKVTGFGGYGTLFPFVSICVDDLCVFVFFSAISKLGHLNLFVGPWNIGVCNFTWISFVLVTRNSWAIPNTSCKYLDLSFTS